MQNSKKSVVQHVKISTPLNVELNKTNNDLNAKIVVNYLLQPTNLFRIPTKKFGLRIG